MKLLDDIKLIDGRIIPWEDIRLEKNNWQFSRKSTGEDLTRQIRLADKREGWAEYDNEAYNRYLSGGKDAKDLPTNVTGIFTKQILTDPLAAPADAAAGAVKTLKETVTSPKFLIIAGLATVLLIGGLVIYYKPRS